MVTSPHKDTVLLIYRQFFGVNEFVLQCFNAIIAQGKLHLEGSIGHSSSLLQEVNNLVAYVNILATYDKLKEGCAA